jgi:hypothetical protein
MMTAPDDALDEILDEQLDLSGYVFHTTDELRKLIVEILAAKHMKDKEEDIR